MKKIALIIIFLSVSILARRGVYCKNFNTQAEAQRYFETHKNTKRLDRDKDGEACECLKGGSGYTKSSCRRWRKLHRKP